MPQDPNDEPASVLLEKIRQEKERLIKEKKIKRDKNASIIYRGEDNSYYEKFILTGEVKCIDDEIPFELPKGWEWCRLGTIFQTSSGTTPQSNNPLYYKDGDINWIRTTDLNNEILRNAEVKITEQACVDYKLKEVPINAVCIAMYGGAGTIGKHALIQFRTTINQSVCAIHPNIDCSSKFLHIFIQYQRPYWMDFAAGSRKDPNINQLIIQHCLFPLPPLAEQQRIVAKIEELMPLVEQYGKAQSELEALNSNIREQLKKSILQYAIEGKLVPQCEKDGTAEGLLQEIQAEKQRLYAEGKLKKKDLTHSTIFRGEDNKYYEQIGEKSICIDNEVPFEIPESWQWCRIGTICIITNGFTPLRTEEKFWLNGDINWFTIDDIRTQGEYINFTKQKITKEATTPKRVVREGSILLCCTASVGQCAFTKIPITTNQQFNALTIKDDFCPLILDEYLFVFAKTLKDELHRLSGKTTFEFVSVKKISNLLIPIPPLNEQVRIITCVKQALSSIMSR